MTFSMVYRVSGAVVYPDRPWITLIFRARMIYAFASSQIESTAIDLPSPSIITWKRIWRGPLEASGNKLGDQIPTPAGGGIWPPRGSSKSHSVPPRNVMHPIRATGRQGLAFESAIASTGPPSGNLLCACFHRTLGEGVRSNIGNFVPDLNNTRPKQQPLRNVEGCWCSFVACSSSIHRFVPTCWKMLESNEICSSFQNRGWRPPWMLERMWSWFRMQ